MSKFAKFMLAITFVIAVLSLALNIILIWQLLTIQREIQAAARNLGPMLQESLGQTIADLEDFEQSTIEVNVEVNEDFPIRTEIALNETVEVPIELTVPISQVIETTITLDILDTGVEIPVDISVPVDVEIPINNTISVPINRSIPISTTIPLDVNVPIAIEVGETDLVQYIAQVREGLVSLNGFVDQLLATLR